MICDLSAVHEILAVNSHLPGSSGLAGLPVAGVRFIAAALALLSWLSLILQWTLMYDRLEAGLPQALAWFFGYFTILSITLVALSFTPWAVYPVDIIYPPITSLLATALCAYIIIVAIIYHLLLRKAFPLTGLDRLASTMLHTWLPVLYVICWVLLIPKGLVLMNQTGYFLIFPVLYLVYILLMGHRTGHYPYPFVSVPEIGYPKVWRNALFIALAFALLSLLLIYLKS